MKRIRRVVQVVIGLTLGLVIAEVVFRFRDHAAFPHVNFYEADAELAVKLKPHASMKLAVPGNPVTEMHTNSRGFRGPEWPARGEDEVLVVGDSQVFGLGVEDGETFSAKLAQLRGHTVINGGVPTYGPREYYGVVERLITERKPKKVVFVLNLSNDLFELSRPNTTRHALWDGWAVRIETAPESIVPFPGRDWVMNQSHLMFALRTWLARDDLKIGATQSEGNWQDIAKAGVQARPPKSRDEVLSEQIAKRSELEQALVKADEDIQQRLSSEIEKNPAFAAKARASGFVQDIIRRDYATEGSRPVAYTARELVVAAVALSKRSGELTALANVAHDAKLVDLIGKREALRSRRDAMGGQVADLERNDLDALFAKTKTLCDAHGAQLLVVALPLDVMVSSSEWAKYGEAAPVDMGPTKALFVDLQKRAQNAGVDSFDATETLAAAEPGAFLYGDLHMTAKGHAALAKALNDKLSAAPSVKAPQLELAPGRSWPPTNDEWASAEECTVKGSTAARCETKCIREWFRMFCALKRVSTDDEVEESPVITVLKGGHGDWAKLVRATNPDGDESESGLLMPFLEGDEVRVALDYATRSTELQMSWPKGGPRVMAIVKLAPPTERRLVDTDNVEGEPLSRPLRELTCDSGLIRSGALRRCVKPCAGDEACGDGGVCYPWPSGAFCGSR